MKTIQTRSCYDIQLWNFKNIFDVPYLRKLNVYLIKIKKEKWNIFPRVFNHHFFLSNVPNDKSTRFCQRHPEYRVFRKITVIPSTIRTYLIPALRRNIQFLGKPSVVYRRRRADVSRTRVVTACLHNVSARVCPRRLEFPIPCSPTFSEHASFLGFKLISDAYLT